MRINPSAPSELVADFLAARVERDQAEERFRELEERLIKEMEADQRKSYRWRVEGRTHTLTYTRSSTTSIDEPGLRRALTAKVFDKYTKRVLDRKRMENAIDAGEVDPVTVSRFVTQTPRKPYLKYTSKEEAE